MHGVAAQARAGTSREWSTLAALSVGFFASGFAALLYQVIWQRMLGLFAGSDAVTAALVVGAFLAGLGLGSLLAGFVADRLNPRRAALAVVLLAFLAGSAVYWRLRTDEIGPLATPAPGTPSPSAAGSPTPAPSTPGP